MWMLWIHNSGFATTGPHRCPYCDEIVMATGIACLVSHLLLKHRRLQLSWFSCICCMGVNALSWASWVNHWDKFHRAATSLMVVLNETSCHSRHSWGVAMLSIVTTTTILGIQLQAVFKCNSYRQYPHWFQPTQAFINFFSRALTEREHNGREPSTYYLSSNWVHPPPFCELFVGEFIDPLRKR